MKSSAVTGGGARLARRILAVAALVAAPLAAAEGQGDRRAVAATGPTIELFTRRGCPRCEEARAFLEGLRARDWPGLRVAESDVELDPASRQRLQRLAAEAGVAPAGVPALLVDGQLVVGFSGAETTGERIQVLLAGGGAARGAAESGDGGLCRLEDEVCPGPAMPQPAPRRVRLPGLGDIAPEELGLPLFTVAMGLVDGINPCATWVLLFLLSILINLRSRARMALVAGTFVVISGAVYFAFMAAWLSFFLVVGVTRVVELVLGGVALVAGGINVKDFFAFHAGPTLSIPDAARPGIYARVRRVLAAEDLAATLGALVVLAVMVNLVELLCTAGLPALYTSILAEQGLSRGHHLAYLGLYNAAYMADDAAMIAVAVTTMRKLKLQERGGRWLKLVSGGVLIALGASLLLQPGVLR